TTTSKLASVIFLGFAYAGSDFMLPVAWAVCLDVGRKYAGAVSGAMNTAGQIGSFLTSVAFGYLVDVYGTYTAALVPMSSMLAWGTTAAVPRGRAGSRAWKGPRLRGAGTSPSGPAPAPSA